MKILSFIVAFLISVSASAQTEIVAKYRAKYPTPMTSMEKVELLKSVAAEVKGGLLIKTGGNNCLGYACDIICFANGDHYDVLGAEEAEAEPRWGFVGKIGNRVCELVNPTEPEPEPEPEPTDFEPLLLAYLDRIVDQNDELIDQNNKLREALIHALQELKLQIANGVPIRFR